jgi:hypothetical protein
MPTKPSVSAYDGLHNLRGGTDAIGAFALGQASAPTYPF